MCQPVDVRSDRRAIDQRPRVVLGTHFRPLIGHHRFRGDGVIQLPSGGSSSGAGAAAGGSVRWLAPTSPAVCCTAAAGAGAINWRAGETPVLAALPVVFFETLLGAPRAPGK